MESDLLKDLNKIVKAPEFIVPWLERFYESVEIKIIENIRRCPTGAKDLRKQLGLNRDTIDRFIKRGVLVETHDGGLAPQDFHQRYDIWALFEGFKDIPVDIRARLNRWELDHYIQSHEKDVACLRKIAQPDPSIVTPRYLLLHEAFEVLDQVDRVYLWPCNCRSMINACQKSIFTCLRFDNSQGQGFEISRERAKEIVRRSNKEGLMQSGELARDINGKRIGAICNCCPDCCFPHLLARELNAEKIWPLSRYTARWFEKKCSFCGLCAKRCPFRAFEYDKKMKTRSDRLVFNEDLCRGCGLCAVTCPEQAIEMEKLNNRRNEN